MCRSAILLLVPSGVITTWSVGCEGRTVCGPLAHLDCSKPESFRDELEKNCHRYGAFQWRNLHDGKRAYGCAHGSCEHLLIRTCVGERQTEDQHNICFVRSTSMGELRSAS